MNSRPAFKTSVCSEYDELLHRCKALFDECRKNSQELAISGPEEVHKKGIVDRLLKQYERSYARLVHHFDHCRLCQAAQASWRLAPPVFIGPR